MWLLVCCGRLAHRPAPHSWLVNDVFPWHLVTDCRTAGAYYISVKSGATAVIVGSYTHGELKQLLRKRCSLRALSRCTSGVGQSVWCKTLGSIMQVTLSCLAMVFSGNIPTIGKDGGKKCYQEVCFVISAYKWTVSGSNVLLPKACLGQWCAAVGSGRAPKPHLLW